eukprot:g16878.t1
MANAKAMRVFLLPSVLAVSISSELVSEGQRQEDSTRGLGEQLKPLSPGALSLPPSVFSSFRAEPTSRLARALRLRPVGWEKAPGKSSGVAVQGVGASALLEVTTNTTTYENLGAGVCACRSPTRKNGLDLCNSDVTLFQPAVGAEKEKDCRKLCTDTEDCMAYQYSGNCVLFLWHRTPIGVFRHADVDKGDFSGHVQKHLQDWLSLSRPCWRKNVQVTDRRERRFQLGSDENFAIMPSELALSERLGGGRLDKNGFERFVGLERFCTCRATTPNGGDDNVEQTETVCKVAGERKNMSQEEAERLCLDRNRRADEGSSLSFGCAGFMSFTPLFSAHEKAKDRSVLFFAGDQTVTGIAATQEQYEKKGGPKTGPASEYLMPEWMKKMEYGYGDTTERPGGFKSSVRFNLPRCVYYVGLGDRHGHPGNLGQAERIKVLFNVAVAGVAVFATALLVVAAFLVVACCKHQKTKRASGAGSKVVKSRKTTHDGQPPTPPVLASTVVPEEPPPGTNEERKHRAAVVDVAPHAVTLAAEYPIYVRDHKPTLERRKDDFLDRGKSPRQPSMRPPTDTATADHDPSHIPPEMTIRVVGVGREEHSPSLLGQYEARMVLAVLEESDLGATESRGAEASPPPNSEARSTEAP